MRKGGFSYELIKTEGKPRDAKSDESRLHKHLESGIKDANNSDKVTYYVQRVDIDLAGANPAAKTETESPSESYFNYFTSGTPESGVANVHGYSKVSYKEIYPFIDLEFSFDKEHGFEYNFIVHPGGDPKQIKLDYKGANEVSLNNGKIEINTNYKEFAESIPHSFIKENSKEVITSYASLGKSLYGFDITDNYDKTVTLVIDPTPNVVWGTLYGGVGWNYVYAMCLDNGNNVYITGSTISSNYIATAGAWQTSYSSGYEIFVAKFNSTGTSLLWGTYYALGYGYAIALDGNDNVYITGYVNSSTGVATPGAWQTLYGGSEDAFVAKFNSTGTTLLWGTYYGGAQQDISYSIALDKSDNAYITGYTLSTSGIATSGTWQTSIEPVFGFEAVFIAEFNSSGSNLTWGTYYGGAYLMQASSIALDHSGNICISGTTTGTNGVATSGAWQTSLGGQDAFIAKFNSTGTTLLWGTYYGGANLDYGSSLALDESDNVFINGTTFSTNGIATSGAWQPSFGGLSDAFVAKFNSTGTRLLWGTYYGGSDVENSNYGMITDNVMVLDANDNVYITGYTFSTNGISTPGAWRTGLTGNNPFAFVAKFNSTGSDLLWGTYYGCDSIANFGQCIALDANNNLYIGGYAVQGPPSLLSRSLATCGAWSSTYYPPYCGQVFLAKFSDHCTLTASIQKTDAGCGQNNGIAAAYPSGSACQYSYHWSTGARTEMISNLAGGVYTITVTDQIGCSSTASITIGHLISGSASASVLSQVSCYGGLNGSLSVSVNGGTSPYTYSWTSGAISQTVAGLGAGSYSVTVTDHNGCTASSTATITQPNALSASISAQSNERCYGDFSGSATIVGNGGTLPYTYSWAPSGGISATANSLTAGSYTVRVTDNCGITAFTIEDITQPAAILTSITSTPYNCGSHTGSATVIASGGGGSYHYSWSPGGAVAATATWTGLGTYTVTVTDNLGCQSRAVLGIVAGTNNQFSYVSLPSPIALNADSSYYLVSDEVNCKDQWYDNNTAVTPGSIASVPTPVFSSSVSPQNWGFNGAADHSYVPVDFQYQTTQVNFVQSQTLGTLRNNYSGWVGMEMQVGAAPITVTSLGRIFVSGNVGSHIVKLVLASTGQDIPGGAVTFTPAGGINGQFSHVPLQAPIILNANTLYYIVSQEVSGGDQWYDNNTAVTPGPVGSIPTPVFSNSNSPQNWGFNGSPNHSYAPVDFQYETSSSNFITAKTLGTFRNNYSGWLGMKLQLGASPQAISALGRIYVNGNGNVHTLKLVRASTGQDIPGGSVNLLFIGPSFTDSIVASSPSCGLDNGSATVADGVPCSNGVFTYLWNNHATTGTISNLAPGTYSVTVTDANSCTVTASTTMGNIGGVTATASTVTNETCFGGNNGSMTVSTSGGVRPYIYLWSNGSRTQTVSGLPAGTYTVIVLDDDGCRSTSTTTITQPVAITASISTTNASCGGNDGSATVTAGNGIGAYTYIWSNGPATALDPNLSAGSYTITVTDANGCSVIANAIVNNGGGTGLATATILSNENCNGENIGSVTVSMAGGASPFNYTWSSGSSAQTVNGLLAGTYFVTVTDHNSCQSISSVTITQPMAVTASISSSNAICGNNNGSATVTPGGGTPGYTYLWSNGNTAATISNLAVGGYTLSLTDANNCSVTSSLSITNSGGDTASITALSNVSCNGLNDGSVTVGVSGSAGPFSYSWVPSVTGTSSASSLDTGTYFITVKDANGCTSTVTATITEPPVLSATTSANPAACLGSNGSVTAMAFGGSGGFTYVWSNEDNTQTVNGLLAGVYTVTVTDKNGCSFSTQDTVFNLNGEKASISVLHNVTCNGANNGSILIALAGGTSPFSYSWTPPASRSDTASNLAAGTYSVTVTDAKGCMAMVAGTVREPTPLIGTVSNSQVGVCAGQPATISASASGGTAPYSYSWTTGLVSDTITLSPDSSTTYSMVVTDQNGCSSAAVLVTAKVTPSPGGTICCDATILRGETANLSVSPFDPENKYLWSPSLGLSCDSCPNTSASPYNTQEYLVTLTNLAGCSIRDSIRITICGDVFMPTAFSPNGDGNNDVLYVEPHCIKSMHLTIYDRWGNRVFETDDAKTGWDGTYKGSSMNADVYAYYLKVTTFNDRNVTKEGNVTLIR